MPDRPNVLMIVTDQQSFRMMSCAGNGYVKTPAMDSIAADGVRFRRAYCTNPVCIPSRFSLFTGRMPTAIGQRSNPAKHLPPIPQHILDGGAGRLLRRGGYETVFAGKQHLPKMNAEMLGFDVLTTDEREVLADEAAAFVGQRRDRPFFLVASFINPHDICHMGIREHPVTELDRLLMKKCLRELAEVDKALRRPEGVDDETFWNELCPPVPDNYDIQADEPEALTDAVERRDFRKYIRDNWTEKDWRMHRWAYARLTEQVDAKIGRVLDALRTGPHADNTVVVFTSDHGDHDASHRLEHKSCLYEEAAHVPLLISAPGGRRGPAEDRLVSNGLDLLPTLCDYAGVDVPADLEGRSLRPLIEGTDVCWRDHLRLESPIALGVVTERYKYALHDYGANREQLYDLERDPGETRNHAADADARDALATCRSLYARYYEAHETSQG